MKNRKKQLMKIGAVIAVMQLQELPAESSYTSVPIDSI